MHPCSRIYISNAFVTLQMEWRKLMTEDSAVKKSFLDTNTHINYLQSYRSGVPEYDLILAQ